MLNINCEDMVVKNGYIDSKILPPLIISQIGIPHHFHLTLKPDHTIVVNRITQLIDNRSGRKSIHLPPLTPDPKPKIIQPPPPGLNINMISYFTLFLHHTVRYSYKSTHRSHY